MNCTIAAVAQRGRADPFGAQLAVSPSGRNQLVVGSSPTGGAFTCNISEIKF